MTSRHSLRTFANAKQRRVEGWYSRRNEPNQRLKAEQSRPKLQ